MFFNEDLILDLRLNELDKFVDHFVIVESAFTHSGESKGFNFNIDKYKKFKDKIIYLKIKKNLKIYIKFMRMNLWKIPKVNKF